MSPRGADDEKIQPHTYCDLIQHSWHVRWSLPGVIWQLLLLSKLSWQDLHGSIPCSTVFQYLHQYQNRINEYIIKTTAAQCKSILPPSKSFSFGGIIYWEASNVNWCVLRLEKRCSAANLCTTVGVKAQCYCSIIQKQDCRFKMIDDRRNMVKSKIPF